MYKSENTQVDIYDMLVKEECEGVFLLISRGERNGLRSVSQQSELKLGNQPVVLDVAAIGEQMQSLSIAGGLHEFDITTLMLLADRRFWVIFRGLKTTQHISEPA